MRIYHFSEQPYRGAWEMDALSLRVTLPNKFCDPKLAADLINWRLDEWQLCDEVGLNIVCNEHHSTATCLSASINMPIAMMAARTERARILASGYAIAQRPDPVRLAEEISYIDVVSRGRLDVGFVKGAPYEISPTNTNPVKITERFWDANDLILKALTHHEGPFSWESEWYHYRQVNIWPRPYQQPRPPVFVTGGSPGTATSSGANGHGFINILSGWNARKLFDMHRAASLKAGHGISAPSKFVYTALMGVGETREEGHRRLMEVAGYFRTTSKVGEAFMNPPGYMDVAGNVRWLKANQTRGRAGHHFQAAKRDGTKLAIGSGVGSGLGVTPTDMADAAIAFTGTPDDVYQQMVEFITHTGGVGNFVIMAQGGEMTHQDACANLELFAREVLPRLEEFDQSGIVADTEDRLRAEFDAA